MGGREAQVSASPGRDSPRRRNGWRVVWIGIAGQVLVAVAVAVGLVGDSSEPGGQALATVALFLGPLFAAAAAFVTGSLLYATSVAHPKRAYYTGVIGGPAAYLVVFVTCAGLVDDAQSALVESLFAFVAPVICGIGMTLLAVPFLPRRGSPTESAPRG